MISTPLSALAVLAAAALLPAQCPHLQAVPVPAVVKTFGKQVCSSGLDLGQWGTLLYQRVCPLRVIVTAARHAAASSSRETDVEVAAMVPVHTFRPACVRATWQFAWIETCTAGAPVVVSAMPSFKTVACR